MCPSSLCLRQEQPHIPQKRHPPGQEIVKKTKTEENWVVVHKICSRAVNTARQTSVLFLGLLPSLVVRVVIRSETNCVMKQKHNTILPWLYQPVPWFCHCPSAIHETLFQTLPSHTLRHTPLITSCQFKGPQEGINWPSLYSENIYSIAANICPENPTYWNTTCAWERIRTW